MTSVAIANGMTIRFDIGQRSVPEAAGADVIPKPLDVANNRAPDFVSATVTSLEQGVGAEGGLHRSVITMLVEHLVGAGP